MARRYPHIAPEARLYARNQAGAVIECKPVRVQIFSAPLRVSTTKHLGGRPCDSAALFLPALAEIQVAIEARHGLRLALQPWLSSA